MTLTDQSGQIKQLLDDAKHVVILQADNPDGDSLASSLALEQIIGALGKQASLYCGVDMPGYLKYLEGWDRVSAELPKQFDLGIIVDASTLTLFQKLVDSGQKGWLAAKPLIVIDHHPEVVNEIDFASLVLNDPSAASTGQIIHELSKELGWPLNKLALQFITTSILSDTQGLSNSLASPATYRLVASLIEAGVDRGELEEARRAFSKMAPEIYKYKAELIKRTEFAADGVIAYVTITQAEINDFSPLYNPGPLVQGDMLQVEGVGVAIALKRYDSGRVTGAIRCNNPYPIAADLAASFGGGGHAYASGFKVDNAKSFDEVKNNCLAQAEELISKLSSK